ncbi:GFA family protein, partial [Pseudomonas aeruginosa]
MQLADEAYSAGSPASQQNAAPLEDVAHCHCSICRRTTGGIVTTWATVPPAAVRWLAGEPAEYASSANWTR